MKATLYDFPFAPNPRRVRWFMAEKGIEDLDVAKIDITVGEHKTGEYRAKVGLPHVPALELEGGEVIAESLAICRLLESAWPEPNLFGLDPIETAQIEMWTRRMELYLANPLMLFTRLTHPALAALEQPNPAVAEYNRQSAERMLRRLDERLEGREFIAADRITMADIVAATGLDFPRIVKWKPDPALANVNRWHAAMRERPAAQAGKA